MPRNLPENNQGTASNTLVESREESMQATQRPSREGHTLFAEIEALKYRCAVLENCVTTAGFQLAKEDGLASFSRTFNNPLDVGSVTSIDNGIVSANQGILADHLNGIGMAAVPAMDMDMGNQLGISSSSPSMTLFGNPINNMHHPALDDEWQHLLDFESSTSLTTRNYDAALPSPVVQGSFGTPVLDNSSPTPGGSGSLVATPSRLVHHCQHCMKSFSRAGDLRRHGRSHNPNATRFSCPRQDCGRYFLRMDKLNDHRARKNH
jgi:hypothetical protein